MNCVISIHFHLGKIESAGQMNTKKYSFLQPRCKHCHNFSDHWTIMQEKKKKNKPIKKVPGLFLILEECSFSYFLLTCFWRVVFISPRLKFNEEKTQWSVIRKTKIALHSQPGGIECHLCFIIYGEAIHFFSFVSFFFNMSFPLCCRELCTACSGAAMLHCLLNRQFPHSRASFSSTSCQGPFWWHHHCCHSHCGPSPLGKKGVTDCCTPISACPWPNTEVSPIRSPCSVASQRQIILDDFILITFSLIFFYLRAAMPHWPRKRSTSGCTRAFLWAHPSTHGNTQGGNVHVSLLSVQFDGKT